MTPHPFLRKELPTPITLGPEHGFMPDTRVPQWVHNYVFNDEGLGGQINYSIATTYLAKNWPQIHGRVWCEQFLVPLMKDIHAPYPNWKVHPSNQMGQLLEQGTAVIGPMLARGGVPQARQFFQCFGAHPADVGTSMYLSSLLPDAVLPVLDYPEAQLPPNLRRLKGKYIVLTAGGTTPIRTMTGEHLNPLIDYVKEIGMMPVLLGKRDLLNTGKVNTTFADDTKYDETIDLRDQTSVKDAARIMQHAACTVGLDGGLLHLAALMKNSRIVFGYNITSIEHRVPRRTHGRTVNVTLTEKELPCIGCQSKWKQVPNTMFDDCFYSHGRAGHDPNKPERSRACLRIMFENKSERFKRAIDEALDINQPEQRWGQDEHGSKSSDGRQY